MSTSERINLILRVTMETGVVVALGFWGYHTGGSTGSQIGLMIAAPLVAFGFWGAVDFHQAGRLAEPLRLIQELAISGLAAIAWYAAGYQAAGLALAGLSLVYHALVYASGARLLMGQSVRSVRGGTRLAPGASSQRSRKR
jgi:Protein of unknown function (DUF2568)